MFWHTSEPKFWSIPKFQNEPKFRCKFWFKAKFQTETEKVQSLVLVDEEVIFFNYCLVGLKHFYIENGGA